MDTWGYYNDFNEFIKNTNLDLINFNNKSFLVTGGTGLIGSTFVSFLLVLQSKFNIKIYVLSRSLEYLKEKFGLEIKQNKIFPIIQDISLPLLNLPKFNFIIHTASPASPDLYVNKPIETINTIVNGTKNILDISNKSRVIYTSTVEVYGETELITEKIKEDEFGILNPFEIRSSYAEAKRISETLCLSYNKEFNTDVVIARLCKTYGSSVHKNDKRVMAHILEKISLGQDICLNSDGSRIFSFCYVTDVIVALVFLLLKGKSAEAYNIADDNSIASLKEIAEISAKIGNVNLTLGKPDNNKGVSKDAIMCTDKIKKLGWEAKINIENGLKSILCRD